MEKEQSSEIFADAEIYLELSFSYNTCFVIMPFKGTSKSFPFTMLAVVLKFDLKYVVRWEFIPNKTIAKLPEI